MDSSFKTLPTNFLEYLSFLVLFIKVSPFFRDMDFKEAAKDKIRWDGTISVNDFSLSASTFSDKWKMLNPSFPPWLWTAIPKHHLGPPKVTPLS